PMAGHLARAGHKVTVYNRTHSKAEQWQKEFGGNTAPTPREAAENQDIVFCCVGNDDDLRAVILGEDGALAGMRSNALLVDNTTAAADVARELFALAKDKQVGFVDAAVSGGEAGDVNGMLTFMCGGEQKQFDTMKPIAAAYAQAITLLGEAGAGQLCKMVY